MEENRTQLFEEMPIPNAVATLAVPTILSSLVMVVYSMADTYFVGRLNDPVQTAAVTLASPVLLSFNAVNNLFGVGSSSMMSRALGRKDPETFRASCAFGFYCALFCGLLFSLCATFFHTPLLTLLGADRETYAATDAYMRWAVRMGAVPAIMNVVLAYFVRSEGNALHASIGTMSGCLLNMILDPIFILPQGLGMGAAGAGLATFLSNCFACCYFFVLLYVRRKQTQICILPSAFKIRKDIAFGVFAVGIPSAIQNLLNVTGMTILNNFASAYSASALAAMGIVQKIQMVPMNIALGFSQGIMPLVSYNYAAKNPKRMKGAVTFSAKLIISFLAVCMVVLSARSGFFTSLFIRDEEVIAYGTRFLRGLSLSLPFLATDFLAVGIFQACGMGSRALIFAVLRKIVLEIPALFILNALFPLYGLAYAQFTAEFVLAIVAVIVLVRLFGNLDREMSS